MSGGRGRRRGAGGQGRRRERGGRGRAGERSACSHQLVPLEKRIPRRRRGTLAPTSGRSRPRPQGREQRRSRRSCLPQSPTSLRSALPSRSSSSRRRDPAAPAAAEEEAEATVPVLPSPRPPPQKNIPHPLPQQHHPAALAPRPDAAEPRRKLPSAGARPAASLPPPAAARPAAFPPAGRGGDGGRQGTAVPPGGEPKVGRRRSGTGGAGAGSEGWRLPGHRLGAHPTCARLRPRPRPRGTRPDAAVVAGSPRGVSPQPAPSPRGRSGTAGLGQPAGSPLEPAERVCPTPSLCPPLPLLSVTVPTCPGAHPGSDARVSRWGGRRSWAGSPGLTLRGLKLSVPRPGMWCACTGAGPEAPSACESANCTDRDGHALPGRTSAGFKPSVARLGQ